MKTLILMAMFLTKCLMIQAQIITTIAGNGIGGYSGDNGPATSAKLNDPQGVYVDDFGNVFIADAGNNRIRKIAATTGIITTVTGNGTFTFSGDGGIATNAAIYSPQGIYVDGSGNLYVADESNSRIRKVTASTGIINTIAGNGGVDCSGDGGLATSAHLYSPEATALDNSGNVYFADRACNKIRKITISTGIITTVAGDGLTIYGGYSGDGGLAINAELNAPQAICLDDSNNIYIADAGNCRIRKVSASTGIITTIAGDSSCHYAGDGGLAINAGLYVPQSVCVDSSYNIYIADFGNQRIRQIIASTGIINTIAGTGIQGYTGDGGPAINAKISALVGICLDKLGNVYIAESGNNGSNRIRKITCFISSKDRISDTIHSSILTGVDTVVTIQVDTISNNVITKTDSAFISHHLNTDTIIIDSTLFKENQCTGVISNTVFYSDTSESVVVVIDTVIRHHSDTTNIITDLAPQIVLSDKIYPNPFNNELNIDFGNENAKITILDILGNIVKQTTGIGHISFSTTDVSPGLYFLKIISKDKTLAIKKIIKAK